MSTTSSSTSSTSSTENTLCDNIESNDSMEESSIIDANVEEVEDDVVFIDETELASNFKSFNKTIWCLEYDCIESMEPFDTVDLLATHMRIEHSD